MSKPKVFFSNSINKKFEIHSYRNAGVILSQSFPGEFQQIKTALEEFQVTEQMIKSPGGSKGDIAKYVDTLFPDNWIETRISADLEIKLLHAKQDNKILRKYMRKGYLDGHRIDFVSNRVALDFEWNSKDQTYDRDLFAFSAFYEAGAIDVGVILTRGTSLDNDYFRGLGKVFMKNGESRGRGRL